MTPETQRLVNEWSTVSDNPELSVLLVWVRALNLIHQENHWIAQGDPFYGDHLLFDRLYTSTNEEIDKVAEKAVGIADASAVELERQLVTVCKIVSSFRNDYVAVIPNQTHLATRSLQAEMKFLEVVDELKSSLASKQRLTTGVDNMICDLADAHEGNVYLLKQRAKDFVPTDACPECGADPGCNIDCATCCRA